MLKLAELLCLAGLHVTFLNTEENHQRLVKFTNTTSRFSQFPAFRFATLPDIPSDTQNPENFVKEMFEGIDRVIKPAFREVLVSSRVKAKEWPPVTCIIADGVMSFTIHVAKELGIPNVAFRTISAACFWAYLCIPKLIQEDELPFKELAKQLHLANLAKASASTKRRKHKKKKGVAVEDRDRGTEEVDSDSSDVKSVKEQSII
ncbi:hypothetical protein GIB67_007719, partial [Kingdonia uniflora]